MHLAFEPGVHLRQEAKVFPGAGGDAGLLRLGTAGAEPLTLAEYISQDHEGVPSHLHPWGEFLYVLEGAMEFVAEASQAAARAQFKRCRAALPARCAFPPAAPDTS